MARKLKPSKRVMFVVEKLKAGQFLCKYQRVNRQGNPEVVYSFEPSGRLCTPGTAKAAIRSGQIKANNDGLFGEDSSQTWAAAP